MLANLPSSASAPRPTSPPQPGRTFLLPLVEPAGRLLEEFILDDAALAYATEASPGCKPCTPHIALIGGFTPRRCGIATFTADIHASITAGFPGAKVDVYAIAPVANDVAFAAPVRGVIVENDAASFVIFRVILSPIIALDYKHYYM